MKYSTVTLQINGIYTNFSAVFEASIDVRNQWLTIAGVRTDINVAEPGPNLVTSTLRGWEIDLPPGTTDFRIRTTAISTGSVSVYIVASSVPSDPYVMVSTSGTTLTQTSNSYYNAVTSVQSSLTDTLLLQANPLRRGASVFNDSPYALYLLESSGVATNSNFSVELAPLGYVEVPFFYTGPLRGLWTTASGFARITEFI